MYFRIFFNIIMLIALAVLQIGLVGSLPGWLKYGDVCLVALVFILVVHNFSFTAAWAIGIGVMLDFFSFSLFGLHAVSLFLTILLIDFLFVNFLTNRSFYSILALAAAAYLINEITFYLLNGLAVFFRAAGPMFVFGLDFFLDKTVGLFINLLLALLIFHSVNIFNKQFRLSILKARI